MDAEAKIIIAFLFNRSGKTELKESELYLPLSMELGWLSTKESQEFIKYALTQKLLIKKGELLQPNFQYQKIIIPLAFVPSKKFFSENQTNLIDRIVVQISIQTKHQQTELLDEIRKIKTEKNLSSEVAALYVAKKYGLDISNWYQSVEKILNKENGE